MSRTAAIYFEPEGYSISRPNIMGRNAAGYGFLRTLFRYSQASEHTAICATKDHAVVFDSMARENGSTKPTRSMARDDTKSLTEIGCMFVPGPGLGQMAFERSFVRPDAWSICGVTHTILSDRVMNTLTAAVTEPVEEWDAIICTSHVVREAIETVFEAEEERLRRRLGAKRFIRPQFPIIPLGVHADDFTSLAPRRDLVRERLGIAKDEVVILFVGRLSFHAKAHPYAMYQALNEISAHHKICLIESGYFYNDFIRDSFNELHSAIAPRVKRIIIDGRSKDASFDAWSAADIFCSLSDNYQETFGLTPIEAMAAGLPVVVSDWNGYRDTVRDGVDGFRIPTTAPPPNFNPDFVKHYAYGRDNYDIYTGKTSLTVGIDIANATTALKSLIENPDLRRKMGDAGRQRTHSVYDWRHVIRQYEDLWAELSARRAHHQAAETVKNPWPARMSPYRVFQAYASKFIDPSLKLVRRQALTQPDPNIVMSLRSFALAPSLTGGTMTLGKVIERFAFDEPRSISDLSSPIDITSDQFLANIAIAIKCGYLIIAEE